VHIIWLNDSIRPIALGRSGHRIKPERVIGITRIRSDTGKYSFTSTTPCSVTEARMKHWYAIHTKPRQETCAAENLRRQEFEIYLPRIKQAQRYRHQWRDKIGPLFPRYLFIRLDLGKDNIAPIRSTRGVSMLVNFSGLPATVPDPFIDGMLQLADPDTELFHPEATLFEAGKTVTIVDGPLEGLEAIFRADDGLQRSIILLDILGKTQQLRIDRNHLTLSKNG
jgi:transcriptional antiterminator RfaH